MTVKIKVKDKLEDDTLDLSYCDLEEVPIREIAAVKKASCLDLSNNQLTILPSSIVTLTNITKLDLSRNLLTEIPENIGEMRQLRHLGLCRNKISRLPLSLGELKNLKWLDLKDNPLTPAVASVAGPCDSNANCQTCAKKIVAYLSYIKGNIEEEKQRRLALINADKSTNKKEGKKKKKNKSEKDSKQNENSNKSKVSEKKPVLSKKSDDKNSKSRVKNNQCLNIFFAILFSLFISFLCISILLFLIFIYLPDFDETISNNVIDYLENQTNLSVRYFQETGIDKKNLLTDYTIKLFNNFKTIIADYYNKIISNF